MSTVSFGWGVGLEGIKHLLPDYNFIHYEDRVIILEESFLRLRTNEDRKREDLFINKRETFFLGLN